MSRQVLVPLVTPLGSDDAVCADDVGQLIASLRHSAAGYIPCLTSGEGWCLSDAQWGAMVQATVAAAHGRPVIAGAERATTAEVIALARRAKQLGASGLMLTSPFGADCDQRRIADHYRAVHEVAELDLYIYNESTLSKNETSLQTLLEICKLPRVVGIKDSAEGVRPAAEVAAMQGHGVAYYAGWEQLLGRGLPVDGCVVSLANLEPALCKLALHCAEPAVADEVMRLTTSYDLLSAQWYACVKRELYARGVISTARTVEQSEP